MSRCVSRLAAAATMVLLSGALMPVRGGESTEDLYPQVHALLKKHCVVCHGPNKQQSGLRLDAGALIHKGGDIGPAIDQEHPEKSLILEAVRGDGNISRMPLDKDPLSADEMKLLVRWVEGGAKFPEDEVIAPAERLTSDHWAFQPVEHPDPPALPRELSDWARNPIDAFIAHRLKEEGLTPSEHADRETLIRRVSLDLIGLLPSPAEIEAFLADREPGAYERLVDRLLASPHYGERWGRYWLDAARYADSNGFTIDGAREVWKYRDWVIDAFNRDLPFDEFTVEQLAGDLLPQPRIDQLVATGFHRNTLANQEGGTDDEQFRVENVVDRVNTTGTVWMGLTIGCCQCHDHKYDPLPQRDYYRLYAIFNNTADNNDAGGLAPKVPLPTPEQAERQRALEHEIAETQQGLKDREEALAAKQSEWEATVAALPSIEWTVVDPQEVSAEYGTTVTELEDHSVLASGTIPNQESYHTKFTSPLPRVTAVRLETLTHDSLPKKGPGLANNGNFVLTEARLLTPRDPQGAAWKSATADHSQENFPITNAIDGKQETGWAINMKKGSMNVPRTAKFALKEPLQVKPDEKLDLVLDHFRFENQGYHVGRFRISVTDADLSGPVIDPAIREIVALSTEERSEEQKKQLHEAYLLADMEWRETTERLQSLRREMTRLEREVPTALIMKELDKPRESYVQIRGDFLSKGAPVSPGTPAVLPPLSVPDTAGGPNRLDFARWLVSPEHPLTARVTVNRIWQRLFGRGIVETENDFGRQGSAPTHPELLDWLAAEFMENGWSMKELQRLIVTSAVYRQSSRRREQLDKADARNILLGRQNRLRLDAEVIRDAALSASGLFSPKLGGPPVYPPQPEGIYALTQSKKDWPESQGEDRYRRTLYTYFWRSSPHPMLPTFDAPDANTTCTRRTRSNTPLQALTLANDRGLVEISQGLAARIVTEGPAYDEGRVRYAFEVCFARQPSEAELERIRGLLERQRQFFAKSPEAAKTAAGPFGDKFPNLGEGAAWCAVARVLMNVDEFMTRE